MSVKPAAGEKIHTSHLYFLLTVDEDRVMEIFLMFFDVQRERDILIR